MRRLHALWFLALVAPRTAYAGPGAGDFVGDGLLLSGQPISSLQFRKNDLNCSGYLEVGPIDLKLVASTTPNVLFFTGIYATIPPMGVGLEEEVSGPMSCSSDADCGANGNCGFDHRCMVPPALGYLNYTPDTNGWFRGMINAGSELVAADLNVDDLQTRIYAGINRTTLGQITSYPQQGAINFFEVGEQGSDCVTGANCAKIASLPVYLYDRCPWDGRGWCDDLWSAPFDSVSVPQGQSGGTILQMTGPWVGDLAASATATVLCHNVPGASFTFRAPTHDCNTSGCTSSMLMNVAVPVSTPVGTYQATVQVKDAASGLSHNLPVPVVVGACTPPPASCPANSCGVFSGCGRSLNCGSCAAGSTCSANNCCPSGTIWSTTNGACQPACNCPRGTYCDGAGSCQPNRTCKPGTCQ